MPGKKDAPPQIGVVGPCAAGKSTLINVLMERGYTARHIAQEHSYVPDMWQRLVNPQHLVYLDVSYDESQQRRPTDMRLSEFEEQNFRLRHAREHASLYIDTDQRSIPEVLAAVLQYIQSAS
jgi:deoxyadenosine/deoxycytidine kinase